MHTKLIYGAIAMLVVTVTSLAAERIRNVVIYDGVANEVTGPSQPSNDLWVTLKDLTHATRFVVKPQGVCRDELCFPLPAKRKSEFISKRGGVTLFNLTAFAALIKQPVARDEKNNVWYFGPWSQAHEGYLGTLDAPDFKLPDPTGKTHSLSEFRGKKVLLVTWASW